MPKRERLSVPRVITTRRKIYTGNEMALVYVKDAYSIDSVNKERG